MKHGWPHHRHGGIAIAVAFGITGIVLLATSRAASPTASFEAENGTRVNATQTTDSTASGGKGVQFSAAATSTHPSGVAMPTTAPGGWTRTFDDDFTTNIPEGSFPQAVASRWGTYDGNKDSSGNGVWNDDLFSVSGGTLNVGLRFINGVPQAAAASPHIKNNGTWGGRAYGRYTVRFRVDPGLHGWAAAWLLWSDTNNWNDGEVDFPEGELDGNIKGFNHCVGNGGINCQSVQTTTPYVGGWHTTTTEWKPGSLKYILDGTTVLTATTSVPTASLHWVLQTETAYGVVPPAGASGKLQVDWITIDSYAP